MLPLLGDQSATNGDRSDADDPEVGAFREFNDPNGPGLVAALIAFNAKVARRRNKFTGSLVTITLNLLMISLLRVSSPDQSMPPSRFMTILDAVRDCVPGSSRVSYHCDAPALSDSFCNGAFASFVRELSPTHMNVTRFDDYVSYKSSIVSTDDVFGVHLESPTQLGVDVPTKYYSLLTGSEDNTGKTCRSFQDPGCAPVQFFHSCVAAVEAAGLAALKQASGTASTQPFKFQIFPQRSSIANGITESFLIWLIPLYLSGLFLNLFNFALIELVSEKEGRHRDYLTSWGISRIVHLIAWLVINSLFGLVAIVLIVFGLIHGGVFELTYALPLLVGCLSYFSALLGIAYAMSVRIKSVKSASMLASFTDLAFNVTSISVGAIHNRLLSITLSLIPTVPFFLLIRAIAYDQCGSGHSNTMFSTIPALLLSVIVTLGTLFACVSTSLTYNEPYRTTRQPSHGLVDVQGLVVRYPPGDVTVLKGVSLTIREREIMTLIGGNGAGKTTLIHSLLGIVPYSECESFAVPYCSDMAVCLQEDAFWEGLTVQDHIDFFAVRLAKASPQRLQMYIDALSLQPLLDQQCSTLSGGQKRRLSVMFALIKAELPTTKLVILDEPTSGVDVSGRRVIWDFVRKVAKEQGKAVLLTTHYLDEAQELSDRVSFLVNGRIEAAGTLMDLQSSVAGGFILKWDIQHGGNDTSVSHMLTDSVPGLVPIDGKTGGVKILTADGDKLAAAVILLEQLQTDGVITSFSVDSVSLENLFTDLHSVPTSTMLPDTDATEESLPARDPDMKTQVTAMVRVRILPAFSTRSSFFSNIVLPVLLISFSLVAQRMRGFGGNAVPSAADHFSIDDLSLLSVFSGHGSHMQVPSMGTWHGPPLPSSFDILPVSTPSMMEYLFTADEWFPFAVDNDRSIIWLNPTHPQSPLAILAHFSDPSITVRVSSFLSDSEFVNSVVSNLVNIIMYVIVSLSVVSTQCSAQIFDERSSFIKRLAQIQGLRPWAYWIGSVMGHFAVNFPVILFAPITAIATLGPVITDVPHSFPVLTFATAVSTIQLILFGYFFVFVFRTKETMFKFNSLISLVFYEVLVLAGVMLIVLTRSGEPWRFIIFIGSACLPPFSIAAVLAELAVLRLTHCSIVTGQCDWEGESVWSSGVIWPILGGLTQVAMLLSILVLMERRSSKRISNPSFADCTWMVDRDPQPDASVIAESARIMNGCQDDVLFVKLWHNYATSPKWVVRDLTLGVRKNEVLGLLGRNGAGKTTALSILLGVQEQTAGYAGLWPGKRVGFCPQVNALWDKLTGIEHIRFFQSMRGVWRGYEGARTVLLSVGLAVADHTKLTREYSGGMKRRLCIAIALIGDPQVVILDEPTAGVDVSGKREIWTVLKKLTDKDCSVLITTHSLEEADNLCSRISIMDSGRLVKIGTTGELKRAQQAVIVCVETAKLNDDIDGVMKRSIGDDSVEKLDTGKFKISTSIVSLSTVLAALQSLKEDNSISNFTVQQLSLEDVFLHTVGSEVPPA